jgi:hypothetical protein
MQRARKPSFMQMLMLRSCSCNHAQVAPDAFELKLISQCKGVKERFFNLQRRFACYRRYLDEMNDNEEEERLMKDAQWFRTRAGAFQIVTFF